MILDSLCTELIEEILLDLHIEDFIVAIQATKRLYDIAKSAKSPLRHRLQRQIRTVGLHIVPEFPTNLDFEFGPRSLVCFYHKAWHLYWGAA